MGRDRQLSGGNLVPVDFIGESASWQIEVTVNDSVQESFETNSLKRMIRNEIFQKAVSSKEFSKGRTIFIMNRLEICRTRSSIGMRRD